MNRRFGTVLLFRVLSILTLLLVAPAAVYQHDPKSLIMVGFGTAVVLVASFVALATLWPEPRLAALRERDWLRYPRALEPVCGAIGAYCRYAIHWPVTKRLIGGSPGRTIVRPRPTLSGNIVGEW